MSGFDPAGTDPLLDDAVEQFDFLGSVAASTSKATGRLRMPNGSARVYATRRLHMSKSDSTTDRICKQILLHAPRERVWSAISDSQQFGSWFGVRFDGSFAPGAHLKGVIQPTSVDAQIAKAQEPYAGTPFHLWIERIEPLRSFAFRWHPYAIDSGTDYSREPTTLVEFVLEEAPGGTLLTITESGFDQVPVARRAEAFKSNEQGWTAQTMLIQKYLARPG
jgi:uncharacterized protein YndB with AHSA1/START domain